MNAETESKRKRDVDKSGNVRNKKRDRLKAWMLAKSGNFEYLPYVMLIVIQ